jgi:hypothetical protein
MNQSLPSPPIAAIRAQDAPCGAVGWPVQGDGGEQVVRGQVA